ncbi:MAG: Phosphoribosylamine--glycine ligase [Bacteroidota bacterium]|jgi:phosphoribosylamine--glycine ligase
MNVLIIGSGGREHAFAAKVAESPLLDELFISPGNPGTAQLGTNLPFGVNDFENIEKTVREKNIELLIVGPEEPLVRGLRDYLEGKEEFKNLLIIGPNSTGAQLEGSKDFSKNFMNKYGIPTAKSQTFIKDTIQEGLAYLKTQSLPIVLKADGLAAGKGVIIAKTLEEAETTLKEMLEEAKFGEASSKVVIETFLTGIELSVFVLSDGKSHCLLPEAKDYKRIFDNDEGLNTGGMGAVSPVSFADETFINKVKKKVIEPTIEGLKSEGIDYKGFIFIGLMNMDGEPYVIEYNVRMGDPETQVVLPRIESDFLSLLVAAGKGKLEGQKLEISSKAAVTTVLVAGGYPEAYDKGDEITEIDKVINANVYHAGTKIENDKLVTNGGRVITVTGMANTIEGAIEKSQKGASVIKFKGKHYRKDIGLDVLRYNKK